MKKLIFILAVVLLGCKKETPAPLASTHDVRFEATCASSYANNMCTSQLTIDDNSGKIYGFVRDVNHSLWSKQYTMNTGDSYSIVAEDMVTCSQSPDVVDSSFKVSVFIDNIKVNESGIAKKTPNSMFRINLYGTVK